MKTRTLRAREELAQFSLYMNGTVLDNESISTLSLNSDSGVGEIKCVSFDVGLTFFEFEMTLHNDVSLPLSHKDQSIYFMYCFEGGCVYEPHKKSSMVRLNELQSAIIRMRKNGNEKLHIESGSPITLNLIRIDVDQYFSNKESSALSLGAKLAAFFSEFEQRHSLIHLGSINLEISELIKKLSDAKYADSLSEFLHFEGICVLILASHIGQYRAEIHGRINSTSLIKRELKVIMRLADIIAQAPEKKYSLDSLCRESGLSAAKLQEGFKFLYQRTVSDYIRNTRLEQAERLLRETDMNISEVVYSVGLTSRSYFCKIFKAKYNCNPKSYKRKVNILPNTTNSFYM